MAINEPLGESGETLGRLAFQLRDLRRVIAEQRESLTLELEKVRTERQRSNANAEPPTPAVTAFSAAFPSARCKSLSKENRKMIEDHVAMHVEHRLWESEDSLRRDELGLWTEDVDRALAELNGLEGTLTRHREALQEALRTVEADQARVQDHDHAIADFERGFADGTPLAELAKRHAESAGHRRDRSVEFEALRKRHYRVMAYWHLLRQALSAPAESGMQRPL